MNLTPSSAAALSDALLKIVQLYSGEDEEQLISTDFYLQPFQENGKLSIFNDNDEEIAAVTIEEWTNYAPDTFYDKVATDLATAIETVNADGELERLAVWMPYSFVLVDEERETITDLLLVDDDKLLVKRGLLAGLDEELNKFIEDLLNE